MDQDDLNALKASELKMMCKERGLRVSGTKSELIGRLMENQHQIENGPINESLDAAVDALLERHGKKETKKIKTYPEPTQKDDEMPIEAELLEEPGPTISTTETELMLFDDDSPPVTPASKKNPRPQGADQGPADHPLKEKTTKKEKSPKKSDPVSATTFRVTRIQVAAGLTVALLISAGLWFFLQRDTSFTAQPIRYGDSVDFSIQQSEINVEGDDMVSIIRDSLSPSSFDQVCSEVDVDISGTGSVSIDRGTDSDTVFPSDLDHRGAFSVKDAYGRTSLAVKQVITHDLDLDLQGKTWRENGIECSNAGWSLPENNLIISTDSYRHISDKSVLRTDTSLSFEDSDGESIDAVLTTFGTSVMPGLGAISPLLSIPLLPMDLEEFFEDTVLHEGASSDTDDVWTWTVKKERNDPVHGYVYPISISHDEIESCFGYLRMELLVTPNSPWPLKQTADIRLDKSLATSQCNVFASAISDAALPEGRLDVRVDMTVTDRTRGDNVVNWYDDYESKPSPGEDRPTSAGKKEWASHMPDESLERVNLEEIVSCMRTSYPASDASVALDGGGYIWEATHPLGTKNWNISWVDTEDNSGWIHLSYTDGECTIVKSGNYPEELVSWDKSAIPRTLTLEYLENRLFNQGRYDYVDEVFSLSYSSLEENMGYRALSGEAEDISDFLSSELSTGVVSFTAEREWTESNKDHTFNVAIDATNARAIGWFQVTTESGS